MEVKRNIPSVAVSFHPWFVQQFHDVASKFRSFDAFFDSAFLFLLKRLLFDIPSRILILFNFLQISLLQKFSSVKFSTLFGRLLLQVLQSCLFILNCFNSALLLFLDFLSDFLFPLEGWMWWEIEHGRTILSRCCRINTNSRSLCSCFDFEVSTSWAVFWEMRKLIQSSFSRWSFLTRSHCKFPTASRVCCCCLEKWKVGGKVKLQNALFSIFSHISLEHFQTIPFLIPLLFNSVAFLFHICWLSFLNHDAIEGFGVGSIA